MKATSQLSSAFFCGKVEKSTREVDIRLPAIAYQTFQNLKDQSFYKKIAHQLIKNLKKTSSPIKRARMTHRLIDEKLKKLFKDSAVKKHVQCTKGCSACCHTQVSITEEEAELLAKRVRDGVEIDIAKLKRQSKVGSSPEDWYQIPYKERGCVFLSEEGECRVYEDRPSVCRTNFVVSDPYFCQTEDGRVKNIRLLNTHEADMAVVGLFSESPSSGALPEKLYEVMNKRKKKIGPRRNLLKSPDIR